MAKLRNRRIAWWKKIIGYPMYAVYYVIKEFLKSMVILAIMIFKVVFKKIAKNKKKEKIKVKSEEKKDRERPIATGKLRVDYTYAKFNVLKTIKGSFDEWENKLYRSDSKIGIILGARGKGKSAIGMKLLENFKAKTNKNIYALGFKTDKIPNWITSIKNFDIIDDIARNSVLLIDEGGITFSSRDTMSNINKLLSKVLLVARHKDLSVIFISQNSSNIDVNAIRQADFLLLKPNSLLQKDLERNIVKKIYEDASSDFDALKSEPGLVYIYADVYRGFVSNPLPSFWSKELSKSFDKVKNK
ncbi:hypothetical protein DRJ17_00180 [Candidatus Woesearchaeota archaeon]|nr:MAG: hypothetical protein DRJ17_00180 [Candidatus Woesearchaeota archaeon]